MHHLRILLLLLAAGACADAPGARHAGACALPSIPSGLADTNVFYKPSDPDHGYALVTAPPAGTPVVGWVILVHGGAWQIGSPRDADVADTAHALAGLGYLAVRPAYRLVPAAIHPAQISDVRCAARWVRDHAASFGAPARGFIAGTSAGAHLALLAALAPDDAPDLDTGDCPLRGPVAFRGAIGWSGVYDLQGTGFPGWVSGAITALLGRAPSTDPAGAAAASPIHYQGPESPPILLAHGDTDGVVPSAQAAAMHARATALGARSTYVLVTGPAGAVHAGPLFDAARPEMGCAVLSFLASH